MTADSAVPPTTDSERRYPKVGKAEDGGDEVVQVCMTATFYNTWFLPLLRSQDFTLVSFPPNPDDLRTFGIGFGETRAASPALHKTERGAVRD